MCKKAILVVSFGTSHNDTREKTIDQIEQDINNCYPEYRVYRAYTSKMIIKILIHRDNIHVFTVSEAMVQMKLDGMEEIIVQPTHVLNGIENDNMIADVINHKDDFKTIKFGTPLLHSTDDYMRVVETLAKELPVNEKNQALIFMGHGTEHYTNTSYTALDYMFKARGYDNVYVATVEAYPEITDIMKQLKGKKYNKVLVTPFMIVSGEHAKNDMAGEEENSWKFQLEKEGFDVSCILKGLGEYKEIRSIFIDHIKMAI